ncbi:MAG: hypothetical protein ABS862_01560 [Carnobacterium inhibens]|uniref:hypothetical protein n=1 Tax=Carnobacterium sp. TaxID=48221 RepID=UPI003315160B
MDPSQIKLGLDLKSDKTLQDFRNELQEISFKELHRMNISGDTSSSNLLNRLLVKLDDDYGTEYQQTESAIKALEGE